MKEALSIDHIGIAVRDLAEEIANYENNFGFKLETQETLENIGIQLAFLKTSTTDIELLAPMSESSTISKFLNTRGPGLHHICYKVTDIRAELEKYSSLGYQLIDQVPRPGARNTEIAFIHPKSMGGVLTELCEYK